MKTCKAYLQEFKRINQQMIPTCIAGQDLSSSCSAGHDAVALKIQKPTWTNVGPEQGVFFSIWLADRDIEDGILNYNIHALKMRELSGYALQSRVFAARFRERLAKRGEVWPGMRVDFGPQTLMQGQVPLDDARLPEDICGLVRTFVKMHGLVDEVLMEFRA